MPEELDRRFLAAAMRLGARALGTTWPNPAVGAIVVKNQSVVGRGKTARGGRPHGETWALDMASGEALRATLYVSLEPCSHYGKTPPCADAIAAAKVARIVAPRSDPDPRVSGKGFTRLRRAGIEVATGLLADEAVRLQAGHISRVERGRPHVVLKLAVSADDAIGRRGERQTPITGDIARRHVQALRSRFDAILVGRGTIEVDDPELTCRLPGLEHRSPVRVVLDSEGRLGSARNVFNGKAPTWVFGLDWKEGGAPGLRRFNGSRSEDGAIDLAACVRRLAEEGITRVLVEGGARVARSFLEADLVDDVILFRSPDALGGDIVPALAGLPLSAIESSERFRWTDRRSFGQDRMYRYERVH